MAGWVEGDAEVSQRFDDRGADPGGAFADAPSEHHWVDTSGGGGHGADHALAVFAYRVATTVGSRGACRLELAHRARGARQTDLAAPPPRTIASFRLVDPALTVRIGTITRSTASS